MFRFMMGVAMGWMAFTEEGRKTANSIGKRAVQEVGKTLKSAGILTDDVPEKAVPPTDADQNT